MVTILNIRQIFQTLLKLNIFVNGISGIQPLAMVIGNGVFVDYVVKLMKSKITSSCWFEQGRVKNIRDTYCLEAGVFQESVKDAF